MKNTLIHAKCPHCGKSFELESGLVGQKGRCDACDTKFIIEENMAAQVVVDRQPVRARRSDKSTASAPLFAVAIVMILGVCGYFYLSGGTETSGGVITHSAGSTVVSSELEGDNPASEKAQTIDAKTNENLANNGAEATEKLASDVGEFVVVENFENLDLNAYRKRYPDVYQGWVPSSVDQVADARNVGDYLGPLGVRIRPYSHFYQDRPAFAAIVPRSIQTENGGLGLNAAEVVQIAPGSPSEGHLQLGDLIVGIEGEMLKSGEEYRPEWKFMHKSSRMFQLMFGEKIDAAQSRGDIRLTVLRYPKTKKEHFSQEMNSNDGVVKIAKISVKAGDEISLLVDANGKNDYDHLSWLSPRLSGSNGELSLADEDKIKPISAKTGWGEVSYGKDLDGRNLGEPGFTVHAVSELIFVVPEGYDSFETSVKVASDKGDLRVRVEVADEQEHLPVAKKELWSGQGGNQNVGVQEFDVELPQGGILTLESDAFDGNIHGDGSMWMDVMLEGDFGKKSLLEIQTLELKAGYGRAVIKTDEAIEHKGVEYQQSLDIHAHGVASWHLPKGTKKVTGYFVAKSYGPVQPKIYHTNEALPLTGIHKEKLVELRYPIGKTGSFAKNYPKDCPKTEQMVKRQAEWLAVQQREDGTWPRLAGYTSDGWDTPWCALALMSSGESKYDAAVKKSAYHVAYDSVPSEWTAERAMRLIFLSEYYLRTKDEAIVAGIQTAYQQLIACCKTDYMAGHKVNGFGYGIAGQHYGTGHLALAMAVASRTPIAVDQQFMENVIRHAGEVTVNGTYAYGRGRRMARDESREHAGGNAMVGPGVLGVQIGGGHESAVKELVERMDASIGDGDNSHATSSLAFIFSSLALSAADEEVFLKHMENFRYKLTIDDNWEGGFLKSHFPLDLASGEGVTAINIRSAGSLLVLNSLKRNLAITGKKEFWKQDRIETVAVSEWGGQVHSYYLRNWCIANELLGSKAPAELKRGIGEMHALERTMELVPETRNLVMKYAPSLVDKILTDKSLSPIDAAYAVELIVGLDFKLVTTEEKGNQMVDLTVNLPLQQLNWLDSEKSKMYADSPFGLKAKVEVAAGNMGDTMEFVIDSLEGFDMDQGTRNFKQTQKLKNGSMTEFAGAARITFSLGGKEIVYKRPMKFNTEYNFSNDYNLRRMNLKLRMAPRAYFQSQPLMISGIAFDCMFPVERMATVIKPDENAAVNLHEGDEVMAEISSENFVCGWVYQLEPTQSNPVKIAKAVSHVAVDGELKGNSDALYDNKLDTAAEMRGTLEYDFGKEVTLNGLDVATEGWQNKYKIWCQKDGFWIPIVWDKYSPGTNHQPIFPSTSARLWRVEVMSDDSVKFQTLRFYFNPNLIMKEEPYPQLNDPKYFPTS